MRRVLWTLIIVAIIAPLSWCTRGYLLPGVLAYDAAQSAGLHDIILLHRYGLAIDHNCGFFDAVAFEGTASDSHGYRVEFTACCAWPFKGSSIHLR